MVVRPTPASPGAAVGHAWRSPAPASMPTCLGGERAGARIAHQVGAARRAALGEPLPPDARCGLLLFLRRGMWAWTQALATATRAPLPPQDLPASVSRPSDVT